MFFFSELSGGGWGWPGSEKQLLDGYIYPDSDFTEWKLVVPKFEFPDPTFIVLAVKVRLPSQQGTLHIYSQNLHWP